MTQEQKDLLLKDLCARLPYRVKVKFEYVITSPAEIIGINKFFIECEDVSADIEDVKPYLFPLSSMTPDQRFEYGKTLLIFSVSQCSDWCNKNHIDYRGLIEKGLAIDATGLNIY